MSLKNLWDEIFKLKVEKVGFFIVSNLTVKIFIENENFYLHRSHRAASFSTFQKYLSTILSRIITKILDPDSRFHF